MSLLRLDKFLADAGLGTRSQVKLLLKKGLVTVNGEAAKRPEEKVDPEADRIACEGVLLSCREFYYYMLNKPAGYVSATDDNTAPTVLRAAAATLALEEERKRSSSFRDSSSSRGVSHRRNCPR